MTEKHSRHDGVYFVSLRRQVLPELAIREIKKLRKDDQISRLRYVILDFPEEINIRELGNLTGEELSREIRLRTLACLDRLGRGVSHSAMELSSEIAATSVAQKLLAKLESDFQSNSSFCHRVESECFRNLHPKLRRLGAKNMRSPLVRPLTLYLLREWAIKAAVFSFGEVAVEITAHTPSEIERETLSALIDPQPLPATIVVPQLKPVPVRLEVQQVSHKYKASNFALNNVSFEAQSGEIIGILGRSGTGKTTLLRLLAGHLRPSSGSVVVHSGSVGAKVSAQEFVTVFQDHGLFPDLTAFANVAIAARLRTGLTRPEQQELTQRMLERLGVGHTAARRPAELSGGEAQRIALCRALVSGRNILLLDEPCAAIDPERKREILGLLQKSSYFGDFPITVIVSHDHEFIASLAHKTIVLHEGKVIAQGPSSIIFERPPNAEVARLLGNCGWFHEKLDQAYGSQVTILVPPKAVSLSSTNTPDEILAMLQVKSVERSGEIWRIAGTSTGQKGHGYIIFDLDDKNSLPRIGQYVGVYIRKDETWNEV